MESSAKLPRGKSIPAKRSGQPECEILPAVFQHGSRRADFKEQDIMDFFLASPKHRHKALTVHGRLRFFGHTAQIHNRRCKIDVGDIDLGLPAALDVLRRPDQAHGFYSAFIGRAFAFFDSVIVEEEDDGVVERVHFLQLVEHGTNAIVEPEDIARGRLSRKPGLFNTLGNRLACRLNTERPFELTCRGRQRVAGVFLVSRAGAVIEGSRHIEKEWLVRLLPLIQKRQRAAGYPIHIVKFEGLAGVSRKVALIQVRSEVEAASLERRDQFLLLPGVVGGDDRIIRIRVIGRAASADSLYFNHVILSDGAREVTGLLERTGEVGRLGIDVTVPGDVDLTVVLHSPFKVGRPAGVRAGQY